MERGTKGKEITREVRERNEEHEMERYEREREIQVERERNKGHEMERDTKGKERETGGEREPVNEIDPGKERGCRE